MSRRDFNPEKQPRRRSGRNGDFKFKEFMKSDGTRIVASALLCGLSLYLAVILISFLFTGGIDQHFAGRSFYEIIQNPEETAGNYGGKLGAVAADSLINKGVGIPALILCYILFITAYSIFRRSFRKYPRQLAISMSTMLWLSLFLGFLSESYTAFTDAETGFLFLGGAHGYYVSIWLDAAIGRFGTFILLAFTLIILMFFGYRPVYNWMVSHSRALYYKWKASRNAAAIRKEEARRAKEEKKAAAAAEKEDRDTFLHRESTETSRENPQNNGIQEQTESDTAPEYTEIKEEEDPTPAVTAEDIPETEAGENGVKPVDFEVQKQTQDELTLENIPDYDPTLDLSLYRYPTLDLLEEHPSAGPAVNEKELEENKLKIVETLQNYKIDIVKIKATIGPTVTLYEIIPAPGIKIAKIKNLEDDIALSLSALGIRIIAPIPGQGTVGIEVPNRNAQIVSMRALIASKKFQESKYALPVVLGRTIANEPYTFDLTKLPHLLVAGATGQGKSVGLNAIITSLLYKKHPAQLKFVMIDPKKVELSIYSIIEKHFMAKLPEMEKSIITDTDKVINTLNSLCVEMDNRYSLLENAMVRTIKEYNEKFTKRHLNPEKGHRYLPYIVVIIDEFADLIMTAGKEVEKPICRIAQLARAVGIHMIIATQRPSTNIITGTIKANFPARIAFKVAQMVDSRTILDAPGANQLIGRGDMLISIGSDIVRLQCAFVDTPEIEKITEFISRQQGYPHAYELPEYVPDNKDGGIPGDNDNMPSKRDDMFEEAARFIVGCQQGSTSSLQRRFGIGFNRAGRIMDQLEDAGIVGPSAGSKPRNVLMDEYGLEKLLNEES